MAIEFKCTECGRALFAQEQYAGMKTTCPGCQSKMLIPSGPPETISKPPAAPTSPTPDLGAMAPDAPHLIDMELIDPKISENRLFAPQPNIATTSSPPEPIAAMPVAPVPEIPEATKRCPICAETIKAAAKKCRFCGEIFDEDLKREAELERRRVILSSTTLAARHSNAIWRGMSMLITMLTTGWLMFQTMTCIVLKVTPSFHIEFLAPWTLYLFNALLIGGLITLIRQMKTGPYHVFLAAGLAIVSCMPLNLELGLPLPGMDQVVAEWKMKGDQFKDLTPEKLYAAMVFGFGLLGLIISLPVWLTALQVYLQARRDERAKQ